MFPAVQVVGGPLPEGKQNGRFISARSHDHGLELTANGAVVPQPARNLVWFRC